VLEQVITVVWFSPGPGQLQLESSEEHALPAISAHMARPLSLLAGLCPRGVRVVLCKTAELTEPMLH